MTTPEAGLRPAHGPEYRAFLDTWRGAVGLDALFVEQLDEVIAAEILAYVEPFVLELTAGLQQIAERRDPITLALGHLLADLVTHLERPEGSVEQRTALIARLVRAQSVLGYA